MLMHTGKLVISSDVTGWQSELRKTVGSYVKMLAPRVSLPSVLRFVSCQNKSEKF